MLNDAMHRFIIPLSHFLPTNTEGGRPEKRQHITCFTSSERQLKTGERYAYRTRERSLSHEGRKKEEEKNLDFSEKLTTRCSSIFARSSVLVEFSIGLASTLVP